MTTQKTFSYEGISVGASSKNEEDIRWLSEFLDPCFADQTGCPDIEVRLEIDRQKFEKLLKYGPGHGSINAYILDTSILSFPIWNTPGPEQVFYEQKHELFYLVEGHQIVLLNKIYDRRSRICLMRVIREFAMGMAQKTGGRFLHASAFNIGGRAAIITGPREAGKTSLLTYVLSNSGADFIANDRLLVKANGKDVQLRGMPTIVSMRSGTLEFFPALLKSIGAHGFDARLTIRECRDSAHTSSTVTREGKHGLSSRQYCSLLSCESIGESKAVSLLFPNQTGRPGEISLRVLEKDETQERLANCLFDNIGPDRLSDVFTPGASGTDNSFVVRDATLCEWLSSELTAYECTLGTEAYGTPEGAQALLQTVAN